MDAITIYINDLISAANSNDLPETNWQSGAATFITTSNAYKHQNLEALMETAQDLIDANDATSRVATKHCEMFHENVSRCRDEENKVYRQIIAMLSSKALD